MIKTVASLLPLLLVAACSSSATGGGPGGSNEPDDPNEALVGCLPVTTTPIGLDEATALGFTAADLLRSPTASTRPRWPGTRVAAPACGRVGDRRRRQRALRGARLAGQRSGMAEPAMDAPTSSRRRRDRLRHRRRRLRRELDDGAIRVGGGPGPARRQRGADPSPAATSVTEVDPAQYDELTLFFDVAIDAVGATGAVAGQAVQGSNNPTRMLGERHPLRRGRVLIPKSVASLRDGDSLG